MLGPILLTLYILPFGNIIYFYSFADHTQLYFSMKPDHNHQLVALAVCSRFVFFLSLSLGFLFLLFLFLCPFVGVCVHGWDLSWVASSGQTHLWQSTTCSWLSHEADSFFTGLLNYSVKPWHLLSCVLCADSDISWFWLCVSCVHRCQDFPPWCVVSQDPEFERERECYL